jgi:hypothetical protein
MPGAPRSSRSCCASSDSDLRLVTPTEPEVPEADAEASQAPAAPGEACYQLAHDALVPTLRQWLTRKQRETRRGRAEIRLAERSDLWNARPEPRFLVSLWEWAEIGLLTRKADWTGPQKRMMKAATRRYAACGLLAAALLGGSTLGALAIRRQVVEQHRATQARGLMAQLLVADRDALPAIIASLDGYRHWVDRPLATIARDPARTPKERLHASLALLPIDPTPAPALLDQGTIFEVDPEALSVICRLLYPYRSRLVDRLWAIAIEPSNSGDRRIRAASMLARFDPDDARWRTIAGGVADQLVRENVLHVRAWSEVLRPARSHLLAGLGTIFPDPMRPPAERSIATGVLGDYTADDPTHLIGLVKDADPEQFAVLFPALEHFRGVAVELMSRELDASASPGASDEARERLARRQANAAIVLLRLGTPGPVWPLLKQSPDPRLRSQLVGDCSLRGVDPRLIIGRLGVERDPSARRALLLALSAYEARKIPPEARAGLVEDVAEMYRADADSGIHGAARCLLVRWGRGERVIAIDEDLQGRGRRDDAGWYINPEGHTMVVVSPPATLRDGPPGSTRGTDSDHRGLPPVAWRSAMSASRNWWCSLKSRR